MLKSKIEFDQLGVGFVLTAITLITAINGCSKAGDGSKSQSGPTNASGVVIGVSLLTRTHPFYQDLEAGLKVAADSCGFKLLITAGEFDVAKQKDQIQDFIVQKTNAIIVSPCDSNSSGTAVKAANDASIPVFTADIACLAEGVNVVTHIASDNIEGGRLAARAVIEAVAG